MVKQAVEVAENGKIRCDACPVLCYIRDGASGACDRYANVAGELVRVDPHFALAMHLDTDEGNAAGIETGARGYIDGIQDEEEGAGHGSSSPFANASK